MSCAEAVLSTQYSNLGHDKVRTGREQVFSMHVFNDFGSSSSGEKCSVASVQYNLLSGCSIPAKLGIK